MDEFQKCPCCGNDTFVEVCLEWTSQEGVRIEDSGEPDYEMSDTVESLGDVVKRQFMCRDCDTDLFVIDGVLTTSDPDINNN